MHFFYPFFVFFFFTHLPFCLPLAPHCFGAYVSLPSFPHSVRLAEGCSFFPLVVCTATLLSASRTQSTPLNTCGRFSLVLLGLVTLFVLVCGTCEGREGEGANDRPLSSNIYLYVYVREEQWWLWWEWSQSWQYL
uniref:T. congolense-specific, cell surface-expressed gene family n=1 Tax=Trypanosoma congolense (strain IL3000) TaxID=1068625 RepID=G0UQ49_TRYCI|nr:hypothetical protein, unlikely [Trypanosoma congolense IL3000]